MNTAHPLLKYFTKRSSVFAAAVISIIASLAAPIAMAEIPDSPHTILQGMYKVEKSNDPLFPVGEGREWFLDFGKGMSTGQTSGKVAVSLRQNPNVRVRIMVWQYFPGNNTILIGNQSAEGSGGAVARGLWSLSNDSDVVYLMAETCGIRMQPADPNDY